MQLPEFHNEPYADFSQEEQRRAMEEALGTARASFGHTYDSWVAGMPAESGAVLASVNPAAPEEIAGRIGTVSAGQAAAAVEDAAAFFPEWAATPAEERIGVLLRAARLLRERKAFFNAWLVLEAGKSWVEAEAETAEAIDFCEYYARQMLGWAHPAPLPQLPGERNELVYLPLGVCVVIPPWNFPLAILTGMTVAALVAGNTVVLKPSSETPVIAAHLAALLREAGLPARALALCAGRGGAIGDALVLHPLCRLVSFTGSRAVGLRIHELAARMQPGLRWIRRVVAELGGKDAIVVDEDTDLEAAVAGVTASAFGYQGQKCSACSRAIVHRAVYDEFLARLTARVEALAIGPGEDPAYALGPVISAAARDEILRAVAAGREEARLVTGGEALPRPGYYVQPTVFADVPPSSSLFREEIFGPVLAVTPARDFAEALALANDSDYGLTGAVYTRDPGRLTRARESFHVGNLYLNRKCTGAMVGSHPFGGFNLSGTDSKAGGPDYLLQFLQAQSIAERLA